MSMSHTVEYHHEANTHSLDGARAGFRHIARWGPFKSVLDVGCGTGTWLRAAEETGVRELWGLDGIPIYRREIANSASFATHDFTEAFELDHTFDVVFCFEVAEHLPAIAAEVLIESICRHTSL